MNATNAGSSCLTEEDPYPFETFIPTLTQCFFIVIAGYLFAKFELMSAADTRGANAFVVWIGMPSIICITLADADFHDLRWELLLALFLGKSFVFALVVGVSLVITGNMAVAGLLAMFCVHSNDLPVGNPLISSLYGVKRKNMMKYLFLMPAMTMAFFLPLGNLLIEIEKSRKDSSRKEKQDMKWFQKKEVLVLWNTLVKASPVLLATGLGIIFNLSMESTLPGFVHQPFTVVAATVPGLVLSALGFSMVRRERYLITSSMVPAAALLTIKMIVTPIALHSLARLLTMNFHKPSHSSDFALLYGIVSPATSVFLLGQEFRRPLAAMSATLILSSFLSFPTSYVVARLSMLPPCDLNLFRPLLKKVLLGVSLVGLPCDVFSLFSAWRKKEIRKEPFCYVFWFTAIQVCICCGVVLWSVGDGGRVTETCGAALHLTGELLQLLGITATTAFLQAAHWWPILRDTGARIISISFFTLSICAITGTVAVFLKTAHPTVYFVGRPETSFEFAQLGVITLLLSLCVVLAGICLLMHFKSKNHLRLHGMGQRRSISEENAFDNPGFHLESPEVKMFQFKQKRFSKISIQLQSMDEDESDLYYKEIFRGNDEIQESEIERRIGFRFFSLLLMVFISLSMKLISNIYKLLKCEFLEVMVPLEFIQASFDAAQGFFVFLTFGIDVRNASVQVTRWIRNLKHRKDALRPPAVGTSQENEVSQFCNQFNNFFFEKCFKDLSKIRTWKREVFENSFWGHQLVDWLIQEAVAKDDVEAEELGQKLYLGGVIGHVTGYHQFYDAPYLYRFLKRNGDSN